MNTVQLRSLVEIVVKALCLGSSPKNRNGQVQKATFFNN